MDAATTSLSCFLGSVSLSMYLRQRQSGRELTLAGSRGVGRKAAPSGTDTPEVIRKEMYSRICSFFGEDKFRNIGDAFVVVVGLGGVGSHAVNMLVRSGVRKVRIIDFDQVTLSSLNRHSLAVMGDVGRSKAAVLRERLLDIAPWIEVDAMTEMFVASEAHRMLAGNPTYVLDCIDDVNTKAELIAYCVKNGLEMLTSMGAGGKSDPTRLRVSQLSDCINDPLATKVKWKLKMHGVQADQVTCVFSNEKPCVDLLALSDEQVQAPQDFGAVDYLRLRVIPVLGTSPAIFGQAMASKVLCALGDKEYQGESCEHMSRTLKHKQLMKCRSLEKRRFGTPDRGVALDEEDIEFVVGQVWGSRCAVTGKRFGGHQGLVMVRWRRDEEPNADNLVLMVANLAQQVEEEDASAKEQGLSTPQCACFTPEVLAKIEKRLSWARTVVKGADADSVIADGPWKGRSSIPGVRGLNWWVAAAAVSGGFALGYSSAVAKAFRLGIELK